MDEHTIEPKFSTIIPYAGLLIGEYFAHCSYCNRPISGDDNSAYHLTDEEVESLFLSDMGEVEF